MKKKIFSNNLLPSIKKENTNHNEEHKKKENNAKFMSSCVKKRTEVMEFKLSPRVTPASGSPPALVISWSDAGLPGGVLRLKDPMGSTTPPDAIHPCQGVMSLIWGMTRDTDRNG